MRVIAASPLFPRGTGVRACILVHSYAKRKMSTLIRRATTNDFRRHIVRRAGSITGISEGRFIRKRETKVGKFQDLSITRKQQVARAIVTMNEPCFMNDLQGFGIGECSVDVRLLTYLV